MRWPLAWRSTLDDAETWRDAHKVDADRRLAIMKSQDAALAQRDETIVALEARLAALTTPAPQPVGKSKLTTAIRDQARLPDGSIDRRLLSYFRGEANRLMREGMAESDIIDSLGQWQTTEQEDRPTAERIVASFNDSAL